MVAIPTQVLDPTLEAADAALEAGQPPWKPRGYAGMSEIGDPCERKLWYGFRWSATRHLPAAGLRAIADGYHGEDVQAQRLRAVQSVTLHTEDANTRDQFSMIAVSGHVRGHMDGAVIGLLQAPKTWHVWEHKQVNETKQRKLTSLAVERGEKDALAAWDVTYHAQAIMYMAHSGMTRHYLTVASPGGRHTISVRTNEDPPEAARLTEKATRIVSAPDPLSRVSDKSEYYWCKWCAYSDICHGQQLPNPTCRTCVHATPEMDGDARWSCARHSKDLTTGEQLAACPDHLYLPSLVTFAQQTDASAAHNTVNYQLPDGRTFANGRPGEGAYSSVELHAMARADVGRILDDDVVADLRRTFDAQVVEAAA